LMSPTQPTIEAKAARRSANLCAGGSRLRHTSPTAGADAAQTDNEWLILTHRNVADGPVPCDCAPALMTPAVETANPGSGRHAGAAMHGRLNAFFAISVNSPSMSMVNFSCCVCSAQKSCAPGVTRRVTPQPTRAALRMEAEAHVRV
jgi:hypothetical protein